MGSEAKTIDADEARLYDRQIRLWGVEAQNRMKNSKVLIVGLRGFQTEVCKNIVLSGIDTAYILDPNTVQLQDLSACFFLTEKDIGSNRAEASAPRIQELNPRVKVITDKEPIESKTEDFFQQFNVVCLSDCSLETMLRVNKICRNKKISLFSGFLCGFHGIVYMDHSGHQYKETKKMELEEDIVEIKTSKMTEWDILFNQTEWSSFRRVSKLLFAHISLLGYKNQNKGEGTSQGFLEFTRKLQEEKKVSSDFIPENVIQELWNFHGKDLSPVAAVVGGFVAQEIIKLLSGKDEPLGNCFVFDGQLSRGLIETLELQSAPPPKKKFVGEAIEL